MAIVKRATLWVLLLMLLTPGAASLARIRIETPSLRAENRVLSPAPTFDWRALWNGSYSKTVDEYANDHFGLRNAIVFGQQRLDWRLFRKTRRDLFAGTGGFIFNVFMATRYQPEVLPYLSRDRAVRLLGSLRWRLSKRNIHLLFVLFPNKELIYQERVPAHWRLIDDPKALPYYQASAKLAKRGTDVWTLAPELLAAKKKIRVFTSVEENHLSPDAFFLVMRGLLTRVSSHFECPIDLPASFPKVYSRRIGDLPGYRASHFVNTNYGRPAPWTRTSRGKQGQVFDYENVDGPLPETVAYSDSFFEVLTREFGPALLPYFRAFSLRWGDYDETAIKPSTRLVIVATSDQNMEVTLDGIQAMLARRW